MTSVPAPCNNKKLIILEPYFGGSHRIFLEGLQSHLNYSFQMLTLPAHGWKWRMRLAAPWFASQLQQSPPPLPDEDCCLLCSTFVDVATLKALLPENLRKIPIATYFHENQFAYPVQANHERDMHFALTNLTTALASDRLAFNSAYNLETFLDGCRPVLKKAPDMTFPELEPLIRDKSIILPPPLDFAPIDAINNKPSNNESPIILWNHRWEHDKNPEQFFNSLFKLEQQGVDFKLIVLGQSFRQHPPVFEEAQKRLQHRIIHFGYAESREEYLQWLHRADLIVSTANHEFFGLSVIEAVRAGCRPLLPKRLAYPELFPKKYLYEENTFTEELIKGLQEKRLSEEESKRLTDPFSWNKLKAEYHQWLYPYGPPKNI